jgi:hypothetical protein
VELERNDESRVPSSVCWPPESLVENDISNGGLVICSGDSKWTLDLEIRLYRSSEKSRSSMVEALWQLSKALATNGQTLRPVAPAAGTTAFSSS